MKFHFRDISPGMCEAWNKWFAEASDVTVSCGDIFGNPIIENNPWKFDAIVSPANSFGFMDGGIDLAYSKQFGWGLQENLQKLLKEEHDGELPVGQAVIVPTGNDDIPYCISAPTMRIPMFIINTVNAYLAFRAVIREVKKWNLGNGKKIESVLCPGLGTAVGRMPFDVCAKQMFAAYMTCYKNSPKEIKHLGDATTVHYELAHDDRNLKMQTQ